jgi:hypothetical protein
MENPPLFHYFPQEAVALGQSPADLGRGAHQQIQRKSGAQTHLDVGRFAGRAPAKRQDHEEIDIGIFAGLAAGVGPEKDDSLGAKLPRQATHKPSNLR